jgi:myo-inositol-1(or 4)-monophosphatase
MEPSKQDMNKFENFAYELAIQSGQKIINGLLQPGEISYKGQAQQSQIPNNPVSESDKLIESFIRNQIRRQYPDHSIIGEEEDATGSTTEPYTWVIDPIDGTTNFINNLPIFGCSIGLMYKNSPIVGAIWLSTSHKLMPGVYHGNIYSKVQFNNQEIVIAKNKNTVKRRLHTLPYAVPARSNQTDVRVSGSAVFEIALLAVGIIDGAYLNNMRLWDIAAGIALLRAAKKETWLKSKKTWVQLNNKLSSQIPLPENPKKIQQWRGTIVAGKEEDILILKQRFSSKKIIKGLVLRTLAQIKSLIKLN